MSELIVYLSEDLKTVTVNADLETLLKSAVEFAYDTTCYVRVSSVGFSRKIGPNREKVDAVVSLNFGGLVANEYQDIDMMVRAAVDAVRRYYGIAIRGKDVAVNIRSTIDKVINVDTA